MNLSTSLPTKKRVLLVDDENTILSTLKRFLEKQGLEVSDAPNGQIARDILGLETFDIVVSDIHMPGSPVSGVELLHFVKKNYPSVPVILMTGFATIAETEEAHNNGASAFLAKPFNREELLKTINQILGTEEPPKEESDEDDNYSKLSIDDFVSGKQIRFSVFVRISKSKYIKIAHEGEDIALDRIKAYKQKGIRHLYLTKQDFISYIKFSLGLSQAVVISTKISKEKKVHFLKHTTELILERLYSNEISQEAFEDAKSTVETSVAFLAESQESFDLIQALNQHSDALYAHSLGVSLYSSMIGKQMKWHASSTIHKLSLAGLLHDVGKKEIDAKILAKSRNAMSFDEVKVVETHPIRGMEILGSLPTVPSDVLQIILQHHERDSGTGYPNGLMRSKIHPLARLVAVADEFCKLVIDGPDQKRISPLAAIGRLEVLYGKVLDAGFIAALKQVLKLD